MDNLSQNSILDNNTNTDNNVSEVLEVSNVSDNQMDMKIEINYDNIEITSVKSSKSSNSDKIDMSKITVNYPLGIVGLHNLIGTRRKKMNYITIHVILILYYNVFSIHLI